MAQQRFAPGECEGLSLGHPSSCGSDPVVAARVHAREVDARKQAVLDEEKGMTLSGAAIGARLERFSVIEIPVPAGTCHVVVWRLGPDAKPGDVRISLDFETKRSSQGGLTGFDLESRVGSTGVECSTLPGKVRFRLVDQWSLAHVASGGTGPLSFEVFTRPRGPNDPDDVGASSDGNETRGGRGGGERGGGGQRGGSVGVDCLDCTFPCESSQTACNRDCFRSGEEPYEKDRCERTCEQIYRACLRGCPGCY
jgi:hypothetical protein